ncbi:hypothetical protein ACVU7I_08030, partial [Patulibacter sp. S7RM1-6]
MSTPVTTADDDTKAVAKSDKPLSPRAPDAEFGAATRGPDADSGTTSGERRGSAAPADGDATG